MISVLFVVYDCLNATRKLMLRLVFCPDESRRHPARASGFLLEAKMTLCMSVVVVDMFGWICASFADSEV